MWSKCCRAKCSRQRGEKVHRVVVTGCKFRYNAKKGLPDKPAFRLRSEWDETMSPVNLEKTKSTKDEKVSVNILEKLQVVIND